MLSVSQTPAVSRPRITSASALRFAELVRKIETSPESSLKKRKSTARKKLLRILKEQRRIAKSSSLRAVALTLTFRDSKAFSPAHISRFLDSLRRALKRTGHVLPYVWTLERAEQLHYHLILWLPRNYVLDPGKLKKWWPWGSTWLEACRCVTAWAKYMTKFDGVANLPKNARLYGYGGVDEAGKSAVSRANLPRWLLKLIPANARVRRCAGGGWVDKDTGQIYFSPYVWTPRGPRLRSISPALVTKLHEDVSADIVRLHCKQEEATALAGLFPLLANLDFLLGIIVCFVGLALVLYY